MRDLRSPERKASDEARREKRRREDKKLKEIASAWREKAAGEWHSIETCPFEALDHAYDADGAIWVSDGHNVALASVRRRFGRPVRVITQPEMVMTDNGMAWVGGEIAEIDAPKWWFEWELTNEYGSMTYAGGEETGKEEVWFVATHWMPAKPKPPAT